MRNGWNFRKKGGGCQSLLFSIIRTYVLTAPRERATLNFQRATLKV